MNLYHLSSRISNIPTTNTVAVNAARSRAGRMNT